MKNRKKILAYSAFTAAGLLVLAVLLFSSERPETGGPDYELRILNGEIIHRREGKKQWLLTASEIRDQKERYEFTGEVKANFYEEGELLYTITCDRITYWPKRGDIVFSENVLVETEAGRILAANRLEWDENREILSGPEPVEVTGSGDHLQADRMEASGSGQIFEFHSNVQLRIEVEKNNAE